ncbi:hypothetical protein DAEQUDRAFT_766836 [Daedalea quercina L-15889]|uniref:SNF2 family DNA-dependent ATPase n=1 Tax=Daedalea quercina L-15889 TaxID=1314783 RepID=A0A165P811_9APHY|nr:hypothetical protein DAEQUDRAFT_766836 [Daedalea quercina L-15889]
MDLPSNLSTASEVASTPTLLSDNEDVASETDVDSSGGAESTQSEPLPLIKPLSCDVKEKKKRSIEDVELANLENPASSKRSKREAQKAHTVTVHEARGSIDTARRRFLHHHRSLFLPLLSPNTGIFDAIGKHLEEVGDDQSLVPLHEIDEQPRLVQGQMKDYQLHGLSFLVWMYRNGMNCILGDEMGLGKTLQTLSFFAYIKDHTKGQQDPHLVVCPLSVLPAWLTEAERWIPSFKVLRFHGQKSERDRLKNEIRANGLACDIMVTTYDTYVAEDRWFKTRRWFCCVLDEGHKIKNADTNVSSKLQGLGSLYRLILTGTPVQNNLFELWSILHWLYPTVFTQASERLFKAAFDLGGGQYSLPFLKATEKLLAMIMLRRTKATVEISVPPREELTVFLPMTEAQRFWTYRLLTRIDSVDLQKIFDSKIEDVPENEGRKEVQAHLAQQVMRSSTGQKDRWKKLMNLLMQLRKVCDHPYLLPNAEPEPYAIGEHLVASSSKLVVLDKLLADILPKGERVLLFTQWTNMLDLLEDFMALRGIPYARLDGSTTRARRALDIKLFQQEHSPYQVFLISTKAGGLGINLTKASTVVLVDSDWNPQNDLQAIARAHRIGQTKRVRVLRLICRGSVEDQMLDRIRRKLFLSLKVMGSDNTTEDANESQMKIGELLNILRKGSNALQDNAGAGSMGLSEFVHADIKDILDASKERDDARTAKAKVLEGVSKDEVDEKLLQDAEEEERKLLAGVVRVQSRLFEGKFVPQSKRPSNADIAKEWQDIQKRDHQDRIIKVDGMEMIAEHLSPVVPTQLADTPQKHAKRSKKKHEHQDWCIYCRDGGELFLCSFCPRVFHAKCHGVSKRELQRTSFVSCAQHKCANCGRSTSDAGGMLFRCRTCPEAFCEDCLPDGDIDAIGDELPELLALNYRPTTSAFYIHCDECRQRSETDPEWWAAWQEEFQAAEKQLAGGM